MHPSDGPANAPAPGLPTHGAGAPMTNPSMAAITAWPVTAEKDQPIGARMAQCHRWPGDATEAPSLDANCCAEVCGYGIDGDHRADSMAPALRSDRGERRCSSGSPGWLKAEAEGWFASQGDKAAGQRCCAMPRPMPQGNAEAPCSRAITIAGQAHGSGAGIPNGWRWF
jgi:hypothetical protein